jgi:glucose dehydrogenase
MTVKITRQTFLSSTAAFLLGGLASAGPALAASDIEWPQYGGDPGFNRYSPANLITKQNVGKLKILWSRPAVDPSLLEVFPDANAAKNFRATPVMIGGVLYSPNGIGMVEAFDAATGKTIWVQEPFNKDPAETSASPTRGVGVWKAGTRGARIFNVRGKWLYKIDMKTGVLDRNFGDGGRVNLEFYPGGRYSVSGGPLIARDLVIVGGFGAGVGAGDGGYVKEAKPEPIRAYSAHTGKLVWSWSPMPEVGDPARASWGEAAEYTGNMGSYGTLAFDDELGYVFVGTSSPDPHYGGWRPGDNLYSNSLVAIDVRTGRKVWHHQLVHHDMSNNDIAGPPVLGYSDAKGRRIKTVMVIGKAPLLFTFDRKTGEPIWPIEERPVLPSTVPGEVSSPTQPFPVKPAPLDRMGVGEDDLIDWTPELRKEALEIYNRYEHGGPYAGPTVYGENGKLGRLTLAGFDGGGNWNTGAFDPETGVYYGATITTPASNGFLPAEEVRRTGATVRYLKRQTIDMNAVKGPRGLPLVKGPYGRITAVDMKTGDFRWVTALGEGPRNHPDLKALNLPRMGIPARAAVAVTKSLIFAGQSADVLIQAMMQGGYASKFNAYDKETGEMLVEIDLPADHGTTGAPITYVTKNKQYVVVAIGGTKASPAWVAMGVE